MPNEPAAETVIKPLYYKSRDQVTAVGGSSCATSQLGSWRRRQCLVKLTDLCTWLDVYDAPIARAAPSRVSTWINVSCLG
jgi:hypothetical protein